MSIALATKGVIWPVLNVCLPQNSYSPILKFDVVLKLAKPGGFLVEVSDIIATPMGFDVENIVHVIATPKGFMVNREAGPATPKGFDAEWVEYVSTPKGFVVEDI